MRWTFSCPETVMIATASTQVVRATTHLIYPWKVRQMPQIIVGLPLDRTLSPSVTMLIFRGGAGHEWIGSWTLCRGTKDVRWQREGCFSSSGGLCSATVKRYLNVGAVTERQSQWLTSCSAEWVKEWTVLTAFLASTPRLAQEGDDTLQAWIQTVYSYTWRCIDGAVKCLTGSASVVMLSLNIMFIKGRKRRGLGLWG